MSPNSLSTRQLTLLSIGIGANGLSPEGVEGITRLQKLLFLLDREEGVRPVDDGFDFTAYRAGPYSRKLYDDLEFLENLGLIESESGSDATDAEVEEIDLLDFEGLLGDGAEGSGGEVTDGMGASDAYKERRFRLTEKGRARVVELLASDRTKEIEGAIRRIRSRFGSHSLSDLLYYVYKKYPEMAVESEIRDRVLRRAR